MKPSTKWTVPLIAAATMVGLAGCGSAPLPVPAFGIFDSPPPARHLYDGVEIPEDQLANISVREARTSCAIHLMHAISHDPEFKADSEIFIRPGRVTVLVDRIKTAWMCFGAPDNRCIRFDLETEAGHRYELIHGDDDRYWFRGRTADTDQKRGTVVAETGLFTVGNACDEVRESFGAE